jgi:hypothetical protein
VPSVAAPPFPLVTRAAIVLVLRDAGAPVPAPGRFADSDPHVPMEEQHEPIQSVP